MPKSRASRSARPTPKGGQKAKAPAKSTSATYRNERTPARPVPGYIDPHGVIAQPAPRPAMVLPPDQVRRGQGVA